MQRTTLTAFLAVTLASAASAQESLTDLARARAAFSGADLDRSGRITLREALAAGHSHADFRAFDGDGDGVVTQDEFVSGYRDQLAGDAGATRPSDALRERVRAAGGDPAGVADRFQERRQDRREAAAAGAGRPGAANARSRVLDALSDLRRTETRPPAPRRDVELPAERVRPAEARLEAAGPAAGRLGASSRDRVQALREALHHRRRVAAADDAEDPRLEEARERVRAARAQRSTGNGARTGGRDVRPAAERGGDSRGGPAARRAGATRSTGVRTRGN